MIRFAAASPSVDRFGSVADCRRSWARSAFRHVIRRTIQARTARADAMNEDSRGRTIARELDALRHRGAPLRSVLSRKRREHARFML